MMKAIFTLAALAASAFAQSVTIAAPAAGTTVTAGAQFTVDIARPNTLTPSEDVSVVIGLLSCNSFGSNCGNTDVSQDFGNILFSGPYVPAHHPGSAPGFIEFYQNFTVTVPANFAAGKASLNVAHFSLIGAGPFPDLEVKNITVNVAASA